MAGEVGLTDAKIAGLKPPQSGQAEHPDKMVPGLRVRIGASGTKTFILRKRVGGKVKNITLGRYGVRFKLADARRKARDLLVDIEGGKDPSATLPTPRKGQTLGTVRAMVESYLAAEVRGKKRSAREIERILIGYVVPALGDRLADSISRADVTKLIDATVNADPERPTPAMGRAVFAQLSAFYSWATPRLERLAANPCRDAGRPPPLKARSRVLSDDEIRAFWIACDRIGPPFGPGFKLLLLTAARRSEVFEARWDEFDGDRWLIPAERSKNGVAHLVPLSPQARALVDALPKIDGSAFLFPAQVQADTDAEPTAVSGFSRATARLRKEMAKVLEIEEEALAPFVLHDLRRSATTVLQRLGTPITVTEAVLNHVSGTRAGVAGVYARHSYEAEKTHALQALGAEIERVIAGRKDDGKVTRLRRRR